MYKIHEHATSFMNKNQNTTSFLDKKSTRKSSMNKISSTNKISGTKSNINLQVSRGEKKHATSFMNRYQDATSSSRNNCQFLV